MGAGASAEYDSDEAFKLFQEISKTHEQEFGPKIKSGEMTERECYDLVKDRLREFRKSKVFEEAEQKMIQVGDVVKVDDIGNQLAHEGVVVEIMNNDTVKVDFGRSVSLHPMTQCLIVVKAEDFEVGDKVEAKIDGTALYCLGTVREIRKDGSLDIHMDGDDEDQVEKGVKRSDVRKIMTRRALMRNRLRKVSVCILAANAFYESIGLDPFAIAEDEHVTEISTMKE